LPWDSLDGAERVTLTRSPLFFVDKTPDGPHQIGYGDVNTPFPENLRDPMHAESAAVSFQDLFLILSQGVDLGLLPVTAAFRAARDLKKILGSGFEMIRISQCESPRVFRWAVITFKIPSQKTQVAPAWVKGRFRTIYYRRGKDFQQFSQRS
jgi:hypothetical protein